MSTREALATAATTVAGVTCTAYYRQTTKPADAWVQRGPRTPDPAIGATDTWRVYLVLPQDVRAAEEWLDDHVDELYAAFATELTVTSITPVELVLDGASTNAVVVEGDREA